MYLPKPVTGVEEALNKPLRRCAETGVRSSTCMNVLFSSPSTLTHEILESIWAHHRAMAVFFFALPNESNAAVSHDLIQESMVHDTKL